MSLTHPPVNDIHNPKYIGPGVWWFLHSLASEIKNSNDIPCVLFAINTISRKFTCIICRDHFNKFKKNDPPEQYINSLDGLFIWTWKCHNNANKLSGKNIVDYQTAYNIFYKQDNSCNNCLNIPLITENSTEINNLISPTSSISSILSSKKSHSISPEKIKLNSSFNYVPKLSPNSNSVNLSLIKSKSNNKLSPPKLNSISLISSPNKTNINNTLNNKIKNIKIKNINK